MVIFTCNSCGEAVKKNQVEKHVYRCRLCTVLSCMDCGKDFGGESYRKHIQCISEEEKYSGKGFVPKVVKNKKAREDWLIILRKCLINPNIEQSVRNLLDRLLTFDNIPTKQQKFENFTKNCLAVKNVRLIQEAWNLISEAIKEAKGLSKEVLPLDEANTALMKLEKPTDEMDEATQMSSTRDTKNETTKKSKREKKDNQKNEMQAISTNIIDQHMESEPNSKKRRKCKSEDKEFKISNANIEMSVQEVAIPNLHKKRKRTTQSRIGEELC